MYIVSNHQVKKKLNFGQYSVFPPLARMTHPRMYLVLMGGMVYVNVYRKVYTLYIDDINLK